MVLNHSCHEQFPCDRPRKPKHLTLSGVYYKLLNTSYIFNIIAGYIANAINFKVVERTK